MDPLISLYQQRLDLQNATFSRIDHDEAMVAIVYQVKHQGQQFILKICPRLNDYLREVYFLKHLADQLPVPRLIKVLPPESTISGAILMEFLHGTLLKPADFTKELAYELGSLLARLHLNRVEGYGDPILPHELSPDPRIHFTLKFEEGFAECAHHLPKTLLEQCSQYYETHKNLLTSVDGPCLIHRDFRPGNLIVNEGKIQGMIDWAGGRASFAEEDFCPLEHGEWPTHPATKKSFLAGYASIRSIPNYMELMPLLRLSRAFATIGFTVKSGTWESRQAPLYQFNRRFLESFV